MLGDEENTYPGTAITAVWVAKELVGNSKIYEKRVLFFMGISLMRNHQCWPDSVEEEWCVGYG